MSSGIDPDTSCEQARTRRLHHTGVVVVDERVWEEPVVVGAEIVYENVTAYVAPADTEMPELDEVLGQPGGVWRQLTITDQARSNPASRVRVELAGADGAAIAAYDAALVHRGREDDVLVAGSLVFRVQARVEGENWVPLSMDADVAGEDYRTLLAANTFLLQLHQAQQLIFRVQDEVELQCTLEDHGPEALLQLRSTAFSALPPLHTQTTDGGQGLPDDEPLSGRRSTTAGGGLTGPRVPSTAAPLEWAEGGDQVSEVVCAAFGPDDALQLGDGVLGERDRLVDVGDGAGAGRSGSAAVAGVHMNGRVW